MNQLLIVLLAVCLVSAHAFVKRDAPADTASDLQKQFQDLQAKVEEITKSLSTEAAKVFDTDAAKKNLEEAFQIAKQALEKLNPTGNKPAGA